MTISRATIKGQVIIPAPLRKKFNIKKGTRAAILEGEGNVILIKPLPDDPKRRKLPPIHPGELLRDELEEICLLHN
jgi:AbrB family looped-hinge helix DNA binding protein